MAHPETGFLEGKENTDYGICDECGDYSKRVSLVGGDWVCENCEKYR